MDSWAGPVDRWSGEDRFTGLWTEMVDAFKAGTRAGSTPEHDGFYHGLFRAYVLVTGEDAAVVQRQVERAATELLAS